MLKTLSIRNVALIDSAEISFSEGLNVLTGETGAGKSVILDSIDFVLGAKATSALIRHGEKECSVRAEFSAGEELFSLLDEMDVEREEGEDTIVISRRFTADGRGGSRINGCPVTSAMLRRVTSRLVDVHGQSEHFYLLKESNQLRLLDKIAGEPAEREKEELCRLLDRRGNILSELGLLGGDEGERNRRLDVLAFQIDELGRAAVKEGEEEELLALREKYRHAEKILTELNAAQEYLLSDGGGADAVAGALRSLSQIARFGGYGALAERLEGALSEINDVAAAVGDSASELDVDEEERERVENRLDEIRSLKKKYGADARAMAEFLARAEAEYDLLKEGGERCERLQKELAETEDAMYESCVRLTEIRKEAARGFSERVVEELKTLNIPSARFEVCFDDFAREDAPRATREGLGGMRFLFSANAGEPPKELGKIISGGEMSRFMLAMKAQLRASYGIGTYLFDEIDAGIGGKTAKVVAEKFCKIAKDTQIVAVSHLAQIASCADKQFLIEKVEEGERTYTRVKELSASERREELARMLSGEPNALSLAHADEMLAAAEKYKNSL